MSKQVFAIILISIFMIPSLSYAGYRCTTSSLAQDGDTREEVRNSCGDPVRIYHDVVKYKGHWENRERWIYDRGRGKALDFYDGVLREFSKIKR